MPSHSGYLLIALPLMLLCGAPECAYATAGAEEREMEEDKEGAAREMGSSINGRVISVNTGSQSLMVENEEFADETYRYAVRPDTRLTEADTLSDIRSGDLVRIDYFVLDDERIATGITVTRRSPSQEGAPGGDYTLPGDLKDFNSTEDSR